MGSRRCVSVKFTVKITGKNVKGFPYMPYRHTGGVEVWLQSFLTSKVDGSEWSVTTICTKCLNINLF